MTNPLKIVDEVQWPFAQDCRRLPLGGAADGVISRVDATLALRRAKRLQVCAGIAGIAR